MGNVPQDVIDDAVTAGLVSVGDSNRLVSPWIENTDISENLMRFIQLRAQRQQGAEPVAIVTVGSNEHGPFSYRETPYGLDHLPDGETPLYSTPPQANALVAAAYRDAAEICEGNAIAWAKVPVTMDDMPYPCDVSKECKDLILAAIPAEAEAALRERDRKIVRAVWAYVSDADKTDEEIDKFVNSVLGEGGK